MQPKLSIRNLEKTFKVNEGFGNVREVLEVATVERWGMMRELS